MGYFPADPNIEGISSLLLPRRLLPAVEKYSCRVVDASRTDAHCHFQGRRHQTEAIRAAISAYHDPENIKPAPPGKDSLIFGSGAWSTGKTVLERYRAKCRYTRSNLKKVLLIDEPLFWGLENLERARFRRERRSASSSLFWYDPSIPHLPLANQEIQDILANVDRLRTAVMRFSDEKPLALPNTKEGAVEESFLDQIRNIGRIYAEISYFDQCCSSITEGWSPFPLNHLFFACKALIEEDRLLKQQVRQWADRARYFNELGAPASELLACLTTVGTWHGSARASLNIRKREIESLLGSSTAVDPGKRLQNKANDLLTANDEDILCNFLELVRYDPKNLRRWLYSRNTGDVNRVGEIFWRFFDLYIIEQKDEPWSESLIPTLMSGQELGLQFAAALQLLEKEDLDPLYSNIENFLQTCVTTRSIDAESVTTILRSLLVGHKDPVVRQKAAESSFLEDLWLLAAYDLTPLESLRHVVSQFSVRGSDDFRKILFASVEMRIASEVEYLADKKDAKELHALFAFFLGWEIFLESRYFDALQSPLVKLFEKLPQFDLDVRTLEREWQKMKISQNTSGRAAKVPEGLEQLPGFMKRHLRDKGRCFACPGSSLDSLLYLSNRYRFLEKLSNYDLESMISNPTIGRQIKEAARRVLKARNRRG